MSLEVCLAHPPLLTQQGYSPSMLSAIRNALVAGTVHCVYKDNKKSLNFREAFYLATVGVNEL